MKISLKGVRGSIPTSGTDTSYYGGNTSCTVVSENDWYLVLDGGSGMQKVTLPSSIKRVDILLTHLHFDHIQGLGFFSPLFNQDMEVHIWGPASATQSLHARISRYLSPPLFPVLLRELPCTLILHDIDNSVFEIGPFTIESRFVIHPGPTVGYRITGQHSVLAYIPDHEPALGLTGLLTDTKWISGFDLVANADLLMHDAQYTAREYTNKIGWGHSSMEDAIRFASLAAVKHLVLTHHDPLHNDKLLSEIFSELQKEVSYPFPFELAIEGREIELP
ncbi:MBL fold metallo-hydrolase [Flavihumibacter profundi]|uniref:MBL fold metallo-hydrolase n=1 Tax=Flavihumibacter profundi TaxID=2716883 RepID=UPI001CC65B1C|nr:MBL fold metallo-hydrolase [Flavihumibacter profundi]MBZ5859575.1 MBL fold metallo-hydrolase [Flavihumibacter profundi]